MTDTTVFRVRWEIDIEAADAVAAARDAETIIQTPIDGSADQARLFNVRAKHSSSWSAVDLAAPLPSGNKHNHAYDFAFSVVTDDPDGDQTPAHLLRQGILARLALIDDDELREAVGQAFDSYSE